MANLHISVELADNYSRVSQNLKSVLAHVVDLELDQKVTRFGKTSSFPGPDP